MRGKCWLGLTGDRAGLAVGDSTAAAVMQAGVENKGKRTIWAYVAKRTG